jgi:hypothetical protein
MTTRSRFLGRGTHEDSMKIDFEFFSEFYTILMNFIVGTKFWS